MKNQVLLVIFLLFGLAFLVYLFPVIFVEGAKLESGVTINAPTTTPPPAGTCPDTNGDGTPDVTGGECTSPTGPAAGTCGLQIVSGVPINYGQLKPGYQSLEQKVTIKNEGTSQTPARIWVHGDDWRRDAGNAWTFPEKITHVANASNLSYNNKKPLSGSGLVLDQISGGQSLTAYFQLRVPPDVIGGSGSFHQEVTIDLIC